jgi:preprotein translocase subunit SecG
MSTLITILHVLVCLFLMLTVLLQSGKGGGMGAAFGGGNAATVFGGSGASSFLRRLTAGAGAVFMLTSMLLAFLASHNSADALERFGEQQEKLAADKESARKKVLDAAGTGSAGAGSASGSASTMVPLTPLDQTQQNGSAAGSATGTPPSGASTPPGPASSQSDSAATPAESPKPATKPDEKPNPATPPSVSPTPTKDDKKPAGAPPGPADSKTGAPNK